MAYQGQTIENPASGERITFRETAASTGGELVAIDLELPAGVAHDFANAGDDEAVVRVEVRPALAMERLFETAVALAEQGRTLRSGVPKPLELALFTREFEAEVQAAFPPRWLQRIALAPLAWLAGLRSTPVVPA